MINETSSIVKAEIKPVGFQGFNPLKGKLAGTYPAHSVAKFQTSTFKDAIDSNAGDGQPLTFKKISNSTDKIAIADKDTATILAIVTAMRNNQTVTFEGEKKDGMYFIKSFNVEGADVPPAPEEASQG